MRSLPYSFPNPEPATWVPISLPCCPGSVYVYVIQQYVFITCVGTAPSLMQFIGSPLKIFDDKLYVSSADYDSLHTYQIVSCHDDAAYKQQSTGDPIVTTKHHVVNYGFVDEISNFDKARYSGHHSKHRHVEWWCLMPSSRSKFSVDSQPQFVVDESKTKTKQTWEIVILNRQNVPLILESKNLWCRFFWSFRGAQSQSWKCLTMNRNRLWLILYFTT